MSAVTTLGSLLLAAGVAVAPAGSVLQHPERSAGFVTTRAAAAVRPAPAAAPSPAHHAPAGSTPAKPSPAKPSPGKSAKPAPGKPIRVGKDFAGALFLGFLLALMVGAGKKE